MCAQRSSLGSKGLIDSAGLLMSADGIGQGAGAIDGEPYAAWTRRFPRRACAALYRRAMLDDVGLFDADFFAYCEDTGSGASRAAGWKCRCMHRRRRPPRLFALDGTVLCVQGLSRRA